MDFVVIDTDVVSFYFKNDARADPFKNHWAGKTLVVSFMTLAELRLWTRVRRWGRSRIDQLEAFVKSRFVVYPVDDRLCDTWATLMAESRANGRNLHHSDAWVAATALVIGASLATNNRKDYLSIEGLSLLI
ncbi:MAG: PIN domain-containing protein [Pirellulales bacterium]